MAWLNELPETQAMLAAEFNGRPISEQNLSEWKSGGFREWRTHRDAVALAHDMSDDAEELTEAAKGSLADRMAVVTTARYAAALAEWDGDLEGSGGKKLRVLRALCQDIVELRRGDHSAARLRMEQERLNEAREKTEEEVVEHFLRWARNPAFRETMDGDELSEEEKARRIRELFGVAPLAQTSQKSDPIKVNQTRNSMKDEG
ncbi:MAG: hypothetical protein H7X97_04910 [Opitutaceae bacterium]|nr:hypothetical protein [Verrucomicrobiales bacterium]